MSETWAHTRAGVQRLKASWAASDDDRKLDIAMWAGGTLAMVTAIVVQFGWLGAVFCLGCLCRFAGNHALEQARKES